MRELRETLVKDLIEERLTNGILHVSNKGDLFHKTSKGDQRIKSSYI